MGGAEQQMAEWKAVYVLCDRQTNCLIQHPTDDTKAGRAWRVSTLSGPHCFRFSHWFIRLG